MPDSEPLNAALEAAEAAATILKAGYRSGVAVTMKADRTPVTEVDIAAEHAILAVLSRRLPNYGFYGEETGRSGDTSTAWIVDPLDGTKSFVRGYPLFSTQIALMRDGEFVLGVSSAPVYGELAWAERGGGAWLNGQRLNVSTTNSLADTALSGGNLKSLARSSAWSRWGSIVGSVSRIRGYGDFLHYHMLASGMIDAVVESDVSIWDIAALATIIEEAGGRFTDLAGEPIGLASTSVLATNGHLHAPLLDALRYEAP